MYMVANTKRQAMLVYIYNLELARFLMQRFEYDGYIFFKAVFQKYIKTYTVSKNTTVLMLMTVNGEKMAFLMTRLVHVNCSYFTRLSKNTNPNFVFLERYGWPLSHLLDMG